MHVPHTHIENTLYVCNNLSYVYMFLCQCIEVHQKCFAALLSLNVVKFYNL